MRKLRVLHLVNELTDASSNRLVLQLASKLDPQRYELHVGAIKPLEGPMGDLFRSTGARVVCFEGGGLARLVRRVALYLGQESVDLLHTHVLRADLVGGFAARLGHRTALVSTKHNMGYVPGQEGWVRRSLLYWPAMYLPDRVIVVTEVLRRQLLLRLRLGTDRVVTIPNGIDTERTFQPAAREECRKELGIQEDDLVVCYTGRLVEGKGLDTLLAAAATVRSSGVRLKLLIAGDGPLDSHLRTHATQLGMEAAVLFPGFRSDIPQLLAASDIFALPSLSEGLPLSLLEAMSAGKPVVVTPVGGIPEVVQSGRNGFLVPARNETRLADALVRLLVDPHLREEMGRSARERVVESYSVERMVREYDAVYRGLVGPSGGEKAKGTGSRHALTHPGS
ncbi:MAG TPA: glycosyltransferase family 4 protein [Chloroflexota bacterium]|nr:glycosyltransferase family 4 protein [Chloroflexota bacterium]